MANLGDLERGIRNGAAEVSRLGQALVDNTIDDWRLVYRNAEDCLEKIDEIRTRVEDRKSEYENEMVRRVVSLNVDLVQRVWLEIQPLIERPHNFKLWQIQNPDGYFLQNQEMIISEINDPMDIDVPGSGVGSLRHTVFVAGMFGSTNESTTIGSLLDPIRANWIDSNRSYNFTDANNRYYFVTFDSNLTDEERTLIQGGYASQLGEAITGAGDGSLLLATYWRELERRAFQAALDMIPYFDRMTVASSEFFNRLNFVGHSLGTYFIARLLQRSQRPLANINAFFIQPALATTAFLRTGEFPESLEVMSNFLLIYSSTDVVLRTVFLPAKGASSMGATGGGPLPRPQRVRRTNVFLQAGLSHSENDIVPGASQYFSKTADTGTDFLHELLRL